MSLNLNDPNGVCRICLLNKQSMSPFKKDLFERLEKCFIIKLITSDQFPLRLCDDCFSLINSTIQLREMIDTNENTLNIYLKNLNEAIQVKLEVHKSSNITSEISNELKNVKCDLDNQILFECPTNEVNEDNEAEQKDLISSIKHQINERMNKTKEQLKCKICGKELSSKPSLKIHMKVHTRVRQVNCKHCGLSYATMNHLQNHIKKIHKITLETVNHDDNDNKMKLFTCEICKKEYTSRKDLDDHMRYGDGHMKCKYCNKFYVIKQYLERHEKTHKNGDASTKSYYKKKLKFDCDSCAVTFDKHIELRMHKLRYHAKKFERKCDHCDLIYKSRAGYNEHLEKVHRIEMNNVKSSFYCLKCEKHFENRRGYYKHVSRLHTDHFKVKCLQCDQIVFKYAMNEHIKYHHTEKKQCEVCDKLVVGDYDKHLSMHSSEEEYNCPQCEKKFATISQLNTHIKSVHYTTFYRKICCQICGKQFNSNKVFRIHMGMVHANEKNHVCDQCGRGYSSVDILDEHKKLHLRKKQFKCTKCPKQYYTRAILKKHFQSIHENYRPLKCEFCQKSFFHKMALIEHTNSHTGKRPYVCKYCNDNFSFTGALYTHIKLKHKNPSRKICQEDNEHFEDSCEKENQEDRFQQI